MKKQILVVLTVTVAFTVGVATAQENLAFEAASVRPSKQDHTLRKGVAGPGIRMSGGPGTADPLHLRYEHVPMLQVFAPAFLVQADQIVGPKWVTDMDAAGFDITANLPAGATREQMSVMMRNLLKERFHLAYHLEQRDLEIYELIIAKGGPKLTDAEIPAQAPEPQTGPLSRKLDGEGYPVLPAGRSDGQAARSGGGTTFFAVQSYGGFNLFSGSPAFRESGGLTRYSFRMVTTHMLLGVIQDILGIAHAVDHTGLTGCYDIKLAFVPSGPSVDANAEVGPDVFSALEKQLGLRLQKTKAPLDVVVIDHIDRTPAEN